VSEKPLFIELPWKRSSRTLRDFRHLLGKTVNNSANIYHSTLVGKNVIIFAPWLKEEAIALG
jgi:hypothetical protein